MLNDDLTLLREYARNHSEPAFAELVSRHVSLIYSVAVRQVRDPQLAEEITQATFIILARKAAAIRDKTILSGWLCRTARYVSARAIRTHCRRQQREQEAHMQSLLNRNGDASSPTADETWPQIAPLLDGALETLGRKDHDALVLRFFENKNFAEVGAALGTGEDTARMRVNRALEKLRKFFTKRGVNSTTEIIAGAISANSIQAAPVGLAKTISAVAVAKGAAASASTLTLIKGALKIMAWTKVKTATAGLAVVLAAGITTITVERLSPSHAPKESNDLWESMDFSKAPIGVIIRETHYTNVEDIAVSQRGNNQNIGRFIPFTNILLTAYLRNPNDIVSYFSPERTIILTDTPTGRFDYLVNMSERGLESLQEQLKKQFGIIGRKETFNTNVYILKVKNPDGPFLRSNRTEGGWRFSDSETVRVGGDSAFMLALDLETHFLHKPVIDETGMEDPHDFTFELKKPVTSDSLKAALLDKFGIELVPTNMPVEMLVVEKAQ